MLKKNPLKRSLMNNQQTYGTWLTIPHILIPEILAPAGFDWMVVDMEHSSIELQDLLPLIISIEANGAVPIVRVGEHSPNLIKRVMDAGSYGIIAANVNSAEDAKNIVNAVKYPPIGNRGVGLYRAQKFGRGFEEYKSWLMEESVVIAQIEHIDAVDAIDDIFSTPGVDGFIVGPYDLSGSLGKPGCFEDPEVKNALKRIMDAARHHKMTAGFHSVSCDPEEAAKRRREGYRFLAFSLDSMFLGDIAVSAMQKLKESV